MDFKNRITKVFFHGDSEEGPAQVYGKRGNSRNIIAIDMIIMLFILGAIIFYYTLLYTETRRGIIKDGQLSANEAAHQIDKYLFTSTESMQVISASLDNMIRDGSSQAEISDFLKRQTSIIEDVNPIITNGVYGVIRGEYMDGSGWIPDDDFEPTQRPWYVSAQANIGSVTVVEPYLDAQTNTIMISLAKTLCDARSVVAMDYPITYIQEVAEKISENNEDQTEIVLDGNYQVIAHSDPEEAGKAYAAEKDTFGSVLVQAIRDSETNYCQMEYGGNDYIIYTLPVENDWLCVSVVNATGAFGRLRGTLALTVVIMVLVILLLSFIMIYSDRKRRQAIKLKENLSRVEKVAFRDSLTGVRSKAAFDQYCKEEDERICSGECDISVVMMDVNDLKYVNDTFGHDKGDIYLRGSCRTICDNFKHSPVFRIGGDEFVAILKNEDYENRFALVSRLNAIFAEFLKKPSAAPWERYSLSVGMADCHDGDMSVKQILKRADEEMYAAKQSFKAVHGSCR